MRKRYKFIAPGSLGSMSSTTWVRKNYSIDHDVFDMDSDSMYEGTFFGFAFRAELVGIDGVDYLGLALTSPRMVDVINSIQDPNGAIDDDDQYPPSDMPLEMKAELAVALLTHHEAAYRRWEREEEREVW